MKKQPLVSIIIPLYNSEKYITQALDSVFAQDYPNMEVIVVNDGSTDDSINRLSPYLDKIILINQGNSGAAAARNTGIIRSLGEYIAFLDADDIWLPGKITAQVEFLESNSNSDFSVVHSNSVRWSVKDRGPIDMTFDFRSLPNKLPDVHSGWILKNMVEHHCICLNTLMIKQPCFAYTGLFNESLVIGEDTDMWIRLATKLKIHKISDVYAVYRINPSSITHTEPGTNVLYGIYTSLLETITTRELIINKIGTPDIHRAISAACMESAYNYLGRNLIIPALRELLLALKHNMKNKVFYTFLWRHLWKILPKSIRNWYWILKKLIKPPTL